MTTAWQKHCAFVAQLEGLVQHSSLFLTAQRRKLCQKSFTSPKRA